MKRNHNFSGAYDEMQLKDLRKLNGLSQKQVAEFLRIDQTTVSKWETGEAIPRADKLFLLAILYNVQVDEIYLPEIETQKNQFLKRIYKGSAFASRDQQQS